VVFWIVCLVAAVLFFVAMPALDRQLGDMELAIRVIKYAALGGSWLAFLRIRSIYRLFREGIEVQGIVRGQKYFNHGQRVTCEYVYDGRPYSMLVDPGSHEPIPGVDGQSMVRLLLDPKNPGYAVVRDMFASVNSEGSTSTR
jgi:hypothetical protein